MTTKSDTQNNKSKSHSYTRNNIKKNMLILFHTKESFLLKTVGIKVIKFWIIMMVACHNVKNWTLIYSHTYGQVHLLYQKIF